jgi:acetyl esterase/lipase
MALTVQTEFPEKAVTWTDEKVSGPAGLDIGVRVYRPAHSSLVSPVAVHLHSGAFVAGSLESGRTVSTLLAEAGAVVASVDYPLAPQHPFPQALDAAFDVLTHIGRGHASFAGKKTPLYVAGEEAGGNLAAALALMARDQRSPILAGQILLSPMLDPCLATCSVREAKAGPAGCQWADGWHHYLGSAAKAAHPYASPIGSSRLAGIAPALLVSAEDDLLRDETSNYARRLRESGVAVAEHLLTAPTGWPCALYRGADRRDPNVAVWTNSLRARFATFFADTLACPSPVSVHHQVQA